MKTTTLLFGTPEFTKKFKEDVLSYCEFNNYKLTLSDDELTHLSWSVGDKYVSPEAGKNVDAAFAHLPFEVKRGLARLYSFDLLMRGTEAAYHEFVRAQEKNQLSFATFTALAKEVQAMNDDVRSVIRISSLLVMSAELRRRCDAALIIPAVERAVVAAGFAATMSADGEEALSQFAVIAALQPTVAPLTKQFNQTQADLLPKMYWRNFHMRWLYSTEGGDNMLEALVQAIKQKKFNHEADLTVWTWRWRLNIAGFQGGPGGKFYDACSHDLIETMLVELRKLFINPDHQFLDGYILKNLSLAGLDNEDLHPAEKFLLGHIITYLAYYHRINIFTADNAAALLAGYQEYKAQLADGELLARNYTASCRNPNAVTPTYVPGATDTALEVFRAHYKDDVVAIKETTKLICGFLNEVYATHLNKRISAMQLANVDNMKRVVEATLGADTAVKFNLSETMELKFEVIAVEKRNQYVM